MKRCLISIVALSLLVVAGYAHAEILNLSGPISKDKNSEIYYIDSNGKKYLLSVNFKSSERKEIIQAYKTKKQLSVIVQYEKILYGPKAGQINIREDGVTIVKVLSIVEKGVGGIVTGVFKVAECGDACYFTFFDDGGKEQTYYANFAELDAYLDNPSYKGKKVNVVWKSVGKKDRVAVAVDLAK